MYILYWEESAIFVYKPGGIIDFSNYIYHLNKNLIKKISSAIRTCKYWGVVYSLKKLDSKGKGKNKDIWRVS